MKWKVTNRLLHDFKNVRAMEQSKVPRQSIYTHLYRDISSLWQSLRGASRELITVIFELCQESLLYSFIGLSDKSTVLIYRRVSGHFISGIYRGMSTHSVNSRKNFFLWLLDPEDGGTTILWNSENHLHKHTISHPKVLACSILVTDLLTYIK
jgi:hypothetical protein